MSREIDGFIEKVEMIGVRFRKPSVICRMSS